MPPVRIRVDLAERGYDVVVGPGVRAEISSCVPPGARRATVVTQAGIGVELDPGVPFQVVTIPDGEQAKSLQTVEEVCRFMARGDMHRSDVVVAVGGGVVTDVAGYAASSYHRGTAVINVPTTLLGQVDAAIGGKTGVNLPEGKNLVGSFWQPLAVLCDTETLASLPEREWRSGHGEMAKYAFLGVEDLDSLSLSEQVARCAACKAEVVSSDEREGGRRMILNYGHTLAHALEAAGLASEDASILEPSFATVKPWASASCSRQSSPGAWAGSGRPESSAIAASSPATACRWTFLPARTPPISSSTWPGTRSRQAASRSCSTVRAAWSRCTTSAPTRCTRRSARFEVTDERPRQRTVRKAPRRPAPVGPESRPAR